MKKSFAIGWWQVAVSMFNQGLGTGSIIIAFSVIAVALQAEFETSRAAVMLIMTITILGNGVANPIVGAAMDRFSIRKILLGGAVVLALGHFALSYATSIVHVYLAYGIFFALANATLGPVSYSALLPRWFVKRRARAVGLTTIGYSIGGFLLPLVFHFLIENFGWRDACRLFGAFIVVFLIPLIAFRIVDRPADVGLQPDGEDAPPPEMAAAATAAPEKLPTARILTDMNFWVITFVTGLCAAGATGVLANLVPLALSQGLTGGQGAFAVSVFSIGSIGSKAIYAAFGDHLKARVGLFIGLGLFVLAALSFIYAENYPVLITAAFLQGLAMGTILPLWSYLTALVFGAAHVGRVFGLMTAVRMPMSFAAPAFLGWMFDVTGDYDKAFYVYLGLAVVAILLVPRLRIPQTQNPAVA